MVAILVHEVVGVAFKLFAELLHDFIYILLREICGAENNGLPVFRKTIKAQAGRSVPSPHCGLYIAR